jgi:hypothetical protein
MIRGCRSTVLGHSNLVDLHVSCDEIADRFAIAYCLSVEMSASLVRCCDVVNASQFALAQLVHLYLSLIAVDHVLLHQHTDGSLFYILQILLHR